MSCTLVHKYEELDPLQMNIPQEMLCIFVKKQTLLNIKYKYR